MIEESKQNQQEEHKDNSPAKRSGIRLTIGFLFSLVAGLLFQDFFKQAIDIFDKKLDLSNLLILLSCAFYLIRTVFDCFIYYSASEQLPDRWSQYLGGIFAGWLEFTILFWCYDFVHELNSDSLIQPSYHFRGFTIARLARDLCFIEATWFVWDFYYLIIQIPKPKEGTDKPLFIFESADNQSKAIKAWLLLNSVSAIVFLILWLSMPKSADALNLAWYIAVFICVSFCIALYMTVMRGYYSGKNWEIGDRPW